MFGGMRGRRTFALSLEQNTRTHARNCYDYEVLIVLSKYAWRRRQKKMLHNIELHWWFFLCCVAWFWWPVSKHDPQMCSTAAIRSRYHKTKHTHTHTREAAAAHLINNFILLNNAAQNTHSRTRLAYYRVSARGCCCYPQLKSIILPA